MILSKTFLESSGSSRNNNVWMKGDLIHDKTPVRFPQLGDGNNEDNCGRIWAKRLDRYPFKIEGCESSLNVLDSGTWPKEFINELGPERRLDRTEEEEMGDSFTVLETKKTVDLIKF